MPHLLRGTACTDTCSSKVWDTQLHCFSRRKGVYRSVEGKRSVGQQQLTWAQPYNIHRHRQIDTHSRAEQIVQSLETGAGREEEEPITLCLGNREVHRPAPSRNLGYTPQREGRWARRCKGLWKCDLESWSLSKYPHPS